MISIIVAIAKNGVIGKQGDIPWYLPDDLKHFATITKGHTVIMGRKTYESIVRKLGKPLPNRTSFVITSQNDFVAPGCIILNSIDDAVKMFSSGDGEVFVIGGNKIYEKFLPVSKKLYITEVDLNCKGDVMFPPYDKNEWVVSSQKHHEMDEKHVCEFDHLELTRKNK